MQVYFFIIKNDYEILQVLFIIIAYQVNLYICLIGYSGHCFLYVLMENKATPKAFFLIEPFQTLMLQEYMLLLFFWIVT